MPAIDRTGAEALIPVEISNEILKNVPQASVVMSMARKLPNMTRKQRNLPILSSLITAGFVTGLADDTSQDLSNLKGSVKAAWTNKSIIAEELAVIVPIPDDVLDDADYDLWGELKPQIIEAFGIAFDQAVLYGTNRPTTWPYGILDHATAAGNTIALGTGVDLYEDILGEGGVVALVEEDGYNVNGHVAALSMRAKLRGLRDANGVPLFNRTMQEGTKYDLDGVNCEFPLNGAMSAASSLLISGDWTQLVYSMRQDITFKLLDQAVIQNSSGTILYNLAQQDMVALRVVMRLGWQLPNPINRVNSTEGGKGVGTGGIDVVGRYPFAILTPGS